MNKYRNVKTTIDGIKFDSKKEAEKYWELKRDPMVKSFTCHPRFLLIPAFEKDGKKYRPTYYFADFDVTYVDDRREIIDIKPWDKKKQKYYTTSVFKIKAKLFDSLFPNLTLVIE